MADESRSSRDAEGGGTDRADGRSCPQCGAGLYRRHCKYVCPNHGVVMDCADTFHIQRE